MFKKYFISTILILLATIVSILPDIYHLLITPLETTFPLIHNYPEDYFGYISYMREGFEGKWLFISRFTPEQFRPTLVYTFYNFLGFMSRISHISLPWMYFLSRIILGITLAFTVLLLLKNIFFTKNKINIGLFFTLFATGFWTIAPQSLPLSPNANLLPINQFLSFWSRLDPVARTTFIPHHLLSTIFGLLSIYFLVAALKENNIKKATIAGILGLLSGFTFHSTMINILGGVTIGALLISIQKVKEFGMNGIKFIIIQMKYHTFYFGLSIISIIYLYLISFSTFPWNNIYYNEIGSGSNFPVPFLDYVRALGPTLILTILGINRTLKTDNFLSKILLGWIIFPFIGLYLLAGFIPKYGNDLYLEATSYIPLGILSIYGLENIYSWIKKPKLLIVTLCLLILYFIPPTLSSIQKQMYLFQPNVYNLFIPNDIFSAIEWLDQNSPPESVVLAGGYFGNIIPAFSHNRVVYGHVKSTFMSWQKKQEMLAFFSQKDTNQASEILKKYRVSYIFFSLDTDPTQDNFLQHLNLQKVYENSKVKIYKVI